MEIDLKIREIKRETELSSEVTRGGVWIGNAGEENAFMTEVGDVDHVFPSHHPHADDPVPNAPARRRITAGVGRH